MYVMVAVPADTPDTTPPVPAVAIEVLLLLQVPPDVVLARVVLRPVHMVAVPVIEAGSGFTVAVTVEKQPRLVT